MSESNVGKAAGVAVAVLLFAALMMVVLSEPFPTSTMAHSEMIPTQPGAEIGSAMSRFLWDFRGMDLTFQTLVLFTTAICCLALLREELKH
jgi:multisubunit Na+/H+ antiporter MnhB subunit